MVHSEHPRYQAKVVRLIHGDPNPAGPGPKQQEVSSGIEGDYQGSRQSIPLGSHVIVPDGPSLRLGDGLSVAAWLYPTITEGPEQGILSKLSADGRSGYALVLRDGLVELRLGNGSRLAVITGEAKLRKNYWYFLAATYDTQSGEATLTQRPYPGVPMDETSGGVVRKLSAQAITESKAPFVIAGLSAGESEVKIEGHFNGKIESPRLYGRALKESEIDALDSDQAGPSEGLIGAWDFSAGTPSAIATDTSPNALHGRVVNMPTRGMTGHQFKGDELDWTRSKAHTAIHFHDDDLEDARWAVAFTLKIPESFRSGIYAARLSAGDDVEHIPFFVRPKTGTATAPILFLAPTNSYLAYANFRTQFAIDEHVLGLYQRHSDGTGVCYSSRLRPIVNLRPETYFDILELPKGGPHQLSADLHLIDWMEEKGFAYDVATDEDLHREGESLLARYRVVVSGSHPEYWSGAMLDGLEEYLDHGGRFMYMGGNGLYAVTSFDPERPHVIEIRREGAQSPWEGAPGEIFHSTTGERGGHWRDRGRAPQRYVGIGFAGQGFVGSIAYRREPGSFDPRASWIFEGVGPAEPLGDQGLVMGGAAGFELDWVDPKLGTPPHALVLASAMNLPEGYELTTDDDTRVRGTSGRGEPLRIRSDLVYFETPEEGAVFATGSIAYCGALSANGYKNPISQITENVLRRFSA